MERLTAFSWGYWGWGTHTPELIRTVDSDRAQSRQAAPDLCGYPILPSRKGWDFLRQCFRERDGLDRYWWIKGLGNRSIETHRLRLEIAHPDFEFETLRVSIAES